MLSPLQERAVDLYLEGKTLREVAEEVGRSHEWVRKSIAKAGELTRNRGREVRERPLCDECGQPCLELDARFCSRDCLNKYRLDTAMEKIQKALEVLNAGGTYAAAAEKAGFQNAWHLWGRLHHFGLTAGRKEPPSQSLGSEKS